MSAFENSARWKAAHEFLVARINYERYSTLPGLSAFKLDRMRELLRRLGEPQERMRIVHVAGTKGKGSTSAMIGAALQAAGYRTAIYTSPHLRGLEERIRVDGRSCSAEELVELVEQVRPAVEALDREAERIDGMGPTWFETTTAMALAYFAQKQVDVAVLEVGLGGRLDSTNVCQPVVAVITSISLDHTKQLGETLGAIAAEKAGIIKPRVPVVSGVRESEPKAVIAERAAECEAPLFQVGRDFEFAFIPPAPVDRQANAVDDKIQNVAQSRPLCGTVDYREHIAGTTWELKGVQLGLAGRHQAANAAVAIATLRRLNESGWRISEEAIRRGLAEVELAARVELVARRPWVVLDTAHNGASVAALLETLAASFTTDRRLAVFAASRDKDVAGMVRQLVPFFRQIVLTQFQHNPRAVPAEELGGLVRQIAAELKLEREIYTLPVPEDAWEMARKLASPEHLLCVTGSFFLVAELWDSIVSAGRGKDNR